MNIIDEKWGNLYSWYYVIGLEQYTIHGIVMLGK
jgi:hypothetical protein